MTRTHPGYVNFPDGFFGRNDESNDANFYDPVRMVTHIDDSAIAAVADLYAELEISGRVLDLMSSWISHFATAPSELAVLGMNRAELDANSMATQRWVHDLNADPTLPFEPDSFDDVVCAVSVDYLVQPLEVFAEVARVLRPGGRFVCTFSNRLFPTKAIRGWMMADDRQRCRLVASYFTFSQAYQEPIVERRPSSGDPLFAVYARAT